MKRIAPIIVIIGSLAFGCTTTNSSSVGSWTFPEEGAHLVYSSSGRLLQKTVWHHGRLVTAWEYECPQDIPIEIIDAVNSGERDHPAPRWIQTVIKGVGHINVFDKMGEVVGWEQYSRGEFYRGGG